jgi:pimeloyl-ACP methyl ester carboxylesterase
MIRIGSFVAGLAGAAAAGSVSAQAPRLAPCRVDNVDAALRCGTFFVHENPADPHSRTIPLPVIVVPSRASKPRPDPVFLVSPGGPGTTNSEILPVVAWYSPLRDERDLVIMDLRGTSGPSRLDCDLLDPALGAAAYLGPLFPKSRVDACRAALEKKVDLRFYTTPIIVQDFDALRRALGYETVNLWGVSWGTRVEYLWLRMHPETVRSAILEGTAPVSFLNPLPHARSAQDAIDSLFVECRRQPACQAAFPNVRAELDSVIARLAAKPATVRVAGSSGSAPVAVPLTRDAFAEGIRTMTYSPRAASVPLFVHEAFEGKYDDFAAAAIRADRGLRSSIRFGFLLAITCTEDVSRIDPRTIARETAGTYLGDARVREQLAACAGWPRGELPKDYGDPVRASVPVFLLSGTADPVAPARFTAEAARYLPNSIHVVAPGGHVPRGACIDSMERAFLESASPRAVDTRCVAQMRLPEFVTR